MKIKLLKDIDDNYYGIHFKKGQICKVLTTYMYNGGNISQNKNKEEYRDLVIAVCGHGAYVYAKYNEYVIIKK